MRNTLHIALILAATALTPAPLTAQPVVEANGGRSGIDPATRRLSVTVVPGITSPNQIGNETMKKARIALGQGAFIPIPYLRALADARDGLAAYRLAEFLMRNEDPVHAADAALYYSVAAGTGRGAAIGGMVRAIDLIDVEKTSPERLAVIRDMLVTYAHAGNSQAVAALMRYHLAEKPFGPLGEDVEQIVLTADPAASAPMALQMATAIMQGKTPTRRELERAKTYLLVAKEGTQLNTALTATNLLAQVDVALLKAPLVTLDFEVQLQ